MLIRVHVQWNSKKRLQLCVANTLSHGVSREIPQGIAERYEIEMAAIDCDRNHIHLLCGVHPKIAPGRIVQIFKSITARAVFRRKPSVMGWRILDRRLLRRDSW